MSQPVSRALRNSTTSQRGDRKKFKPEDWLRLVKALAASTDLRTPLLRCWKSPKGSLFLKQHLAAVPLTSVLSR